MRRAQSANVSLPAGVTRSVDKIGILSIVASLAEGVVKAMFVSKLKAALSVVMVFAVAATFLACRTAAAQDGQTLSSEKPLEPAPKQQKKLDKKTFSARGNEQLATGKLELNVKLDPKRMAEKQVTVTFLAGAKKVPLGGLKVTIKNDTGHWTDDRKAKPLTEAKTDKDGTARFTLSDGSYFVDINSDKELPYLDLPLGYKGAPGIYDRLIKVGKDTAFDFNLADACKLTLRAVDETGKGIPGVEFEMVSETYEYGGAVVGDNLGADHNKQGKEATDKDGYLTRYMAPHGGYTYFAWPTPKGYEVVGNMSVEIPTPLGKSSAEHVFKFKKK